MGMRMAAPVMNDSQKYGKYLAGDHGRCSSGIVQYGGWDDADKREFISALVVPRRNGQHRRGVVVMPFGIATNEATFCSTRGMSCQASRDCKNCYKQRSISAASRLNNSSSSTVPASPDRFVKDILAQLGHRRYQVVGNASEQVETHRKTWRKAAKRARDNFMLYRRMSQGQYMYQLQAALKAISSYISAIKNDKAVRTRMQLERLPTNSLDLEMMREQLKDTIRRRKQGGGGGGRGGGGGGGLGGPGGV